MLLEPIKLTLYDPETQEPIKEYQQQVITFEMLLAAVQLQEALAVLPAKKRRWWWQKSISQEVAQINAMMELVVCFFGNRFTVEELRRGAEVSEVMAVYRSILSRPKAIVSANPTIPPGAPETALDDGGHWLLDLQCMVVDLFHWSLIDLAKTDVDLLLPFVLYYPHWKNRSKQPAQEEKVFADQADWL